jgi:hypothetical protein
MVGYDSLNSEAQVIIHNVTGIISGTLPWKDTTKYLVREGVPISLRRTERTLLLDSKSINNI